MKQGLIRPIDKMGRVVIPKEYRAQLGVENEKDSFEIFFEGDKIILKKFQSACVFCNRTGPGVKMGEYVVCKKCINKINEVKDYVE